MEDNKIKTEYIQCLICEQDREKFLYQVRDKYWQRGGEFNLVECRSCGLRYINPRPDKNSIGYFYQDFYQEGPNLELQKKVKKAGGLMSRIINKDRILDIKKNFTLSSQARVLDIGCGLGGFLANIKKDSGCSIYGLDFDPRVAEHLNEIKDMDYFHGELADARYQDQFFDLITMWGYLEHSFDPIGDLREAARILKPDGMLVINVPNGDSMLEKIFRHNWFFHSVPQHLYSFDRYSLAKVLDKSGFQMLPRVYFPVTPLEILGSILLWATPNNDLMGTISRNKWTMKLMQISAIPLGVLELPLAIALSLGKKSSRLRVFARKANGLLQK